MFFCKNEVDIHEKSLFKRVNENNSSNESLPSNLIDKEMIFPERSNSLIINQARFHAIKDLIQMPDLGINDLLTVDPYYTKIFG